MATYANYHETLSSAVDVAHTYFDALKIVLANDAIREAFQFDGVKYGHTREAHGEIATLKGKPTKKFVHVSIYRMESGRYELTCYVL